MLAFSFPLFVPASRPDRFQKAAASGADTIIIDLEDAVQEGRKDQAREQAAQTFSGLNGSDVWLRVNASDTRWHEKDVEVAVQGGLKGIVLPKAESAEQIRQVRARMRGDQLLIALVESARGIRDAYAIAEVSDRLLFGSIDFALDAGCAETDEACLMARSTLVIASRAARIPAPLDGVTVKVNDEGAVRSAASYANGLGFGGKLLIHPAQLKPARAAFAPSAEDIEWARKILSSGEGGEARSLDGDMIDAPVVERARRLLVRLEETA
ncbi:MAG TPA: CoA ester lyase [Henriciella marina]|uniref:HpcH/HpaI aldolase/citrate lyase family protein n=1 Tax=Henriciella sp. TaxID=1968823 RepID=UPI0017A64D2F|nr:CoA ester lyase [Henriciella sp.]HIG23264.1 CoA ester lyase [Henriciella sp.]HIK64774.1 CoA ester lyase [Henriciella marina]